MLKIEKLNDLKENDGLFLLYKHSPICPISTSARNEVDKFEADFPDIQICIVDVISQRNLSGEIASEYDVLHASPQLIAIESGKVLWSISHFEIRSKKIKKKLNLS